MSRLLGLLLLLFAVSPALAQLSAPEVESVGWFAQFYAWLSHQQSQLNRELRALIIDLKDGVALGPVLALLGGAFLYGLLHAAGPGHGKVIISSYLLGGRANLWSGLRLTLVSSLAQAVTAVLFVGLLAVVLDRARTAIARDVQLLELVSYGLIILMGCVMAWRVLRHGNSCGHDHGHHDHAHDHGHDHGHHHALPRRDFWSMVLAVGIRPCSGAVIVLLVTLSQGLWIIGIAATFAMAAGTSIAVGALALLAVGSRDLALRLSGGSASPWGRRLLRGLGLLGALAVIGLGALFFSFALETPPL